jgi:hypothetical protein
MAVNSYFNNYAFASEQGLAEDLIIESIKMYGHDVQYLPRTLVKEDLLFGEDTLSAFNVAATIEVYIKNVEGFEGEGDLLSKFGLEIRDEITFTVAVKRFEQFQSEKLLTEGQGYNVLLETGDEFLLEDANGDNFALSLGRPFEGDLIYFPLNGKIFQIDHVEHEEVFYSFGRLYTYDLRCTLFEYSHETISTGNATIDQIETDYSGNALAYEMLLETGDKILLEDGGSFIKEDYLPVNTDAQANNTYFTTTNYDDNIIDFSEINPFGEAE